MTFFFFTFFQSICEHFVVTKYRSSILLKAFDGLYPLMHLPTIRTKSLKVASHWCRQKEERPYGCSDNGTDLASSYPRRYNKTENVQSGAEQNNSAADINTDTNRLWLIIDSPSYNAIYIPLNVNHCFRGTCGSTFWVEK
jgi:hypothetical protein